MLDLVTPLEEVLAVVTDLSPLVDARFAPVVATTLRGDEAGRDSTA
jgi:hypothetical protein